MFKKALLVVAALVITVAVFPGLSTAAEGDDAVGNTHRMQSTERAMGAPEGAEREGMQSGHASMSAAMNGNNGVSGSTEQMTSMRRERAEREMVRDAMREREQNGTGAMNRSMGTDRGGAMGAGRRSGLGGQEFNGGTRMSGTGMGVNSGMGSGSGMRSGGSGMGGSGMGGRR